MAYDIIKFLHVALAILWLGGGFAMWLLGTLALRRGDEAEVRDVAGLSARLANTLFMPSGVVVLILGTYLVRGPWSFLDAWVLAGIAGVVASGVIGAAVLAPRVRALAQEGGQVAARALFAWVRVDLVLLFAVVWAMVSKPLWSDWPELALMALAVALAAVAAMRQSR